MQQHIGQVVAGWVQAVKLAVQRMRYPGKRMPVARMESECPDEARKSQPRLDVAVLRHVLLIVKFDEVISKRRQIDQQRSQRQAQAQKPRDQPVATFIVHTNLIVGDRIQSATAKESSAHLTGSSVLPPDV